jgi:hypothetical protein
MSVMRARAAVVLSTRCVADRAQSSISFGSFIITLCIPVRLSFRASSLAFVQCSAPMSIYCLSTARKIDGGPAVNFEPPRATVYCNHRAMNSNAVSRGEFNVPSR